MCASCTPPTLPKLTSPPILPSCYCWCVAAQSLAAEADEEVVPAPGKAVKFTDTKPPANPKAAEPARGAKQSNAAQPTGGADGAAAAAEGVEVAEGAEDEPAASSKLTDEQVAALAWSIAYKGPQLTYELTELDTDREYALRVCACNVLGQGAWSEPLRATTLALEEQREEAAVPAEWLALRGKVEHLLGDPHPLKQVLRDTAWAAVESSLRRHQKSLRVAFRMHALRGAFLGDSGGGLDTDVAGFSMSSAGSPNSMGLRQFKIFLQECAMNAPAHGGKAVAAASADEIFLTASPTEGEEDVGPIGAIAQSNSDGARLSRANRNSYSKEDLRLSLHEFVLAVMLLSDVRYSGTAALGANEAAPLAKALDLIMEHDIIPFSTFGEVFDEMSRVVNERKVRSVLAKHGSGLARAYKVYSAVVTSDEADADDGEDLQQLDLPELLVMLRDAHVLDESCTARSVIAFYTRVNLDDELFTAVDGAAEGTDADSAQLDYSEFTEIICRVCDKKLPPPRLEPFEVVLDKWLGLIFLPAVKAKGRKQSVKRSGSRPRTGSLLDV